MISFFKQNFLGVVLMLIFFIAGIATLSRYGHNIDEPIHFIRGQGYLHFFLTGKMKYDDNDFKKPRVSTYKIKSYDPLYWFQHDSGHPPLNGILAAVFNRIFYEKLGILGDLESYHLFEITVSALLVLLLYVIVRERYGVFAGTISSISLVLYPLFLGESHFNIKDPAETTFFAYTLYFFVVGLEKLSAKRILLAALFAALAFGTKFNIVFLPLILTPYFFVRYFHLLKKIQLKLASKIPFSIYASLLILPLIVFGIHFLTRPYLWSDPINRFFEIIRYYKDIGAGKFYQPAYVKEGWNLYPPFFIIISTPLIILWFFGIGVFSAFIRWVRKRDMFAFLLLLWFAIPIVRVMWPGSSIYSGVRQIMEYVPAMAALSGVGALTFRDALAKILKSTPMSSVLIICSFIPLLIHLIKIHPNENVYINSLVGGVSGAVEKKIPGAAESMGNVYLQGLQWINQHAEKNAHYHTPVGLGSNVPRQFERPDIKFGPYFSGMRRDGEYMMEMVSVDFPPPRYNFMYLDRFLIPVHEVIVDGVPLLKVWKNDLSHTKEGYKSEKVEEKLQVNGGKEFGYIVVRLPKREYLTRVEVAHENTACKQDVSGTVQYSRDGEKFFLSADDLVNMQGPYARALQTDTLFVFFFPATDAITIKIIPEDSSACLLQFKKVTVKSLRDISPE